MSFLDADYSAIEARIVCWLAGEEFALREYRAQDAATTDEEKRRLDRYRIMASEIFGIHIDLVNSYPQRFIGKQAILLCGFQGGASKFRQTCAKYGYKDMPAGLENTAVDTFRAKHKRVKQYWYDVEKCAKRAILSPGEVIHLQPTPTAPRVSFGVREVSPGLPFLLIRLPSGRKLAYPRPWIGASKKLEGAKVVWFFGAIGETKQYGDVETYGGKFVENITQAVAADIMANGAHKAEEKEYPIATLIHDQALGYRERLERFGLRSRELTAEGFAACLTDLPAWAEGLPIAAESSIVPFYKKD